MTAAARPGRAARATHALMEAWTALEGGPLTAAQVCEYDDPEAALTVRHTAAALTSARRLGLIDSAPGPGHNTLWVATGQTWEMRRDLQDLFEAEPGTPATRPSVPPLSEPLQFIRNNRTLRIHILAAAPPPERGSEPDPVSFAEGLARMFMTPVPMLCPVRLIVGGADTFPGSWAGGDDFTDDQLCVRCVRALGDQQWRAFHVHERGEDQ